MKIDIAIAIVGLLVFLAHLFVVLFRFVRSLLLMRLRAIRIPDVLLLIVIGIGIGPVFKLVFPEHFGEVGPVFTHIALAVGLTALVFLLRNAHRPLGHAPFHVSERRLTEVGYVPQGIGRRGVGFRTRAVVRDGRIVHPRLWTHVSWFYETWKRSFGMNPCRLAQIHSVRILNQ